MVSEFTPYTQIQHIYTRTHILCLQTIVFREPGVNGSSSKLGLRGLTRPSSRQPNTVDLESLFTKP